MAACNAEGNPIPTDEGRVVPSIPGGCIPVRGCGKAGPHGRDVLHAERNLAPRRDSP